MEIFPFCPGKRVNSTTFLNLFIIFFVRVLFSTPFCIPMPAEYGAGEFVFSRRCPDPGLGLGICLGLWDRV